MDKPTEIKINDWKFENVCQIIPKIDPDGNSEKFFPQTRYENKKNLPLNKYGKGPFCKFSIDREYAGKSGVYIISTNGHIQYVGECDDFHSRFSTGYGNISPRNCFEGGQLTNCRINSEILKSHTSHEKVQLYFFETEDRYTIENSLILNLNPPWNKTIGKPSKIK